ncbi:hypothetical protein RUM44_006515 [Polyplax serrata]|uniref:Uncharacterized protein n=1 Tax=Polyplax serrata TaxID=468196 RepID=A0ABR1AIC7_POLSC
MQYNRTEKPPEMEEGDRGTFGTTETNSGTHPGDNSCDTQNYIKIHEEIRTKSITEWIRLGLRSVIASLTPPRYEPGEEVLGHNTKCTGVGFFFRFPLTGPRGQVD